MNPGPASSVGSSCSSEAVAGGTGAAAATCGACVSAIEPSGSRSSSRFASGIGRAVESDAASAGGTGAIGAACGVRRGVPSPVSCSPVTMAAAGSERASPGSARCSGRWMLCATTRWPSSRQPAAIMRSFTSGALAVSAMIRNSACARSPRARSTKRRPGVPASR